MQTNTTMLDTRIPFENRTDLTSRVSLFLKSKKQKNREVIKLRTFKETNITFLHLKSEFDTSRKYIKDCLKNEVWQVLHASRDISEEDFGSYFIGLKGDLYKSFKRAEMNMQDSIDKLIESTYKRNITHINSLKKVNSIDKKFHRSIREMILSELFQLITDAKNDRLNFMLKLKSEIIDFVKDSGKIKKERSERFGKELRAEIYAITR